MPCGTGYTVFPLQDGVVELGVLGCPNLPQGAVNDEDGGAGALDRAAAAGASSTSSSSGGGKSWGALFLGHKGRGAYMADLYGKEVRRGDT
jgi:3'(2'), 5'-bisphosphate nucleotidase/inositol polyphosphate 1-phosphatase